MYLGSLITSDNECSREIKRSITPVTRAMAGFNKIWRSNEIQIHLKIEIQRTCICSLLLYAAEAWTIKKIDQNRLLACQMRCYRRIMRIMNKR